MVVGGGASLFDQFQIADEDFLKAGETLELNLGPAIGRTQEMNMGPSVSGTSGQLNMGPSVSGTSEQPSIRPANGGTTRQVNLGPSVGAQASQLNSGLTTASCSSDNNLQGKITFTLFHRYRTYHLKRVFYVGTGHVQNTGTRHLYRLK